VVWLETTDFCRKTSAEADDKQSPREKPMNNGPTLGIGATGRDVRRLQRIFVMIKTLDPGSITAQFESSTEQAVEDSSKARV